ncbi:MAG: prephenate dehydrogenase/arogenate dehydrogenase family protein, partial [Prolixibacteraceae bacterium]|nr:prephenate dehydrogenase/arogenate dehydrogenase family protein [Prolixibacteraceae bacterium]
TVQDKADRKIIFDLASGGFNSTVRLAKSAKSMWLPIFGQNKDYLAEALNVYMKHLELFRKALLKDDDSELETLLGNANQIRKVLDPVNAQLVKNEEVIIKYYMNGEK